MFFTAVLRVAEKRSLAGADITDNVVQLHRNEKCVKKGTSRTGGVDRRRGEEGGRVHKLWGVLCTDDADIVPRSSTCLERMMTVIATACSAFGYLL